MKPAAPVAASPEARVSRPRRSSLAAASDSGRPHCSIADSRSLRRAVWGSAASSRASPAAAARAWPSGTTRLTRPMARASAAPTTRPVRMRSMARPWPTIRGRRTVPRSTRGTPTRRLSTPKAAPSAATRRSHQRASSRPPPTAGPSTAASTGLDSRSQVAPIGPSPSPATRSGSPAAIALRSAPAQNAPPAPVSTATAAPGSRSKARNASARAAAAGASTALRRSGRSMVTTVTGPWSSTRTPVPSAIGGLLPPAAPSRMVAALIEPRAAGVPPCRAHSRPDTARSTDVADAIPLVDVRAAYLAQRDELDEAVAGVVGSGGFILGPEVEGFEAEFAAFCGTRRAVGVASGTAAIHLALAALGAGPGDEVVTVAHTFTASAEALVHAGARPRFVDVDEVTGGMDPKALAGAVEGAAAVLPVHLYGLPVDMPAILAVAGDAGVPVVEDAAQAHGATLTGADGRVRRAGSLGRLAAWSFYPGKNLGAFGDAGAVTTDDEELAGRVARLRDHGRTTKYEHAEVGWGERLDALQAAVLRVKLRRLEAGNATRERLAGRYDQALAGVGDLVPPPRVEGRDSARHLHVVRTRHRDELLAACRAAGVGAGVHYPIPLHLQPAWRHLGLARGDLPVTEAWAEECLSLPLYPELTEAQQDRVVEVVRGFFGQP